MFVKFVFVQDFKDLHKIDRLTMYTKPITQLSRRREDVISFYESVISIYIFVFRTKEYNVD